jgi:hypothetical protein
MRHHIYLLVFLMDIVPENQFTTDAFARAHAASDLEAHTTRE